MSARAALTVKCPRCLAGIGAKCRNKWGSQMTNAHRARTDAESAAAKDRKMSMTFTPRTTAPATVISYTKTLTVTTAVPIPEGYQVETTGRYPREDEYYLYVGDDDGVSAVRQATAEDLDLRGLVADYDRDRFVILVKKSRMVSTFTETGEYRVPQRGEYYGWNGEIRMCGAGDDVTYPVRIVTCHRTMVQG